MEKHLKQFNNEDTLLVITLYPHEGELYSAGTSGVAMYTKNIVSRMKRQVVILANIYDKKRSYVEDNGLVIRCFNTTKLSMWKQVLTELNKFNKVKNVLIQFDFAIYGRLINSAQMIPFLLLLRLKGYNVSVVNHHIVVDVNKISGHVGLTNKFKDKVKALVMNIVFHSFYMLLGLFAKRIIVLEETLKTMLSSIIPSRKIAAIPIGVDTDLHTIDKKQARAKLGIADDTQVVLFFGFINWFKGADFFTKTFAKEETLLGKPLKAILAGGISATQKDKKFYQEYYQGVMQSVEKSSSTSITGYVPQKDIETYFSASDLVVFPYRHYMTASGVLSLVFSYKKPFILSEDIVHMFEAEDLSLALTQTGLKTRDLSFALNKTSCLKTTKKVLKNGLKQKMANLSEIIREKRSYANTAAAFEAVLFSSTAVAATLTPALALKGGNK